MINNNEISMVKDHLDNTPLAENHHMNEHTMIKTNLPASLNNGIVPIIKSEKKKEFNCVIEVDPRLNKRNFKHKKNRAEEDVLITDKIDDVIEFEDEKNHRAVREKRTPYSIAQYMLSEFEIKHDDNLILHYSDGFWQAIVKDEELRGLRQIVPRKYVDDVDKRSLAEIFEWLIKDSDKFDPNYENDRYRYINFSDCAVDLLNSEILAEEERKDKGFKYALRIPYRSDAQGTGVVERFVKESLGNDDATIVEFSKFFALALGDLRNQKRAYLLYGPSNTGKSLMLNYIGSLVGTDQYSTISFAQFDKNFSAAQLLGKRLNISSEISGTSNERLDVFKSLTGNDRITTSFKYKADFQFFNESMLVFAGNVLPQIKDCMEAESVIDRIIIFPFMNILERDEWNNNMLEELVQDVAGTIKLLEKGVKALSHDNGIVYESKKMLKAKRLYMEQSDSFGLFLREKLYKSPKSKIASADLDSEYRLFCDENDIEAMRPQKWSPILKRSCPWVKPTFVKDTFNNQVRGYKGIAIKESGDNLDMVLPVIRKGEDYYG